MDLSDDFVLANYHLNSPDIRSLSQQIRFWVYASIKGGMITGEKRVGKTYAIRFLIRNLSFVLGHKCYAFAVRWTTTRAFQERRFWLRLLGATGFDTTLPGDSHRLEQRFYERIDVMTDEYGLPMCVMFIDEAQSISITEFLKLCHVFNELEERGIRLHTFLVGQDELHHMKTMMQEAGCGQVIARFMEHSFKMKGINNATTLKVLLEQLDKREIDIASNVYADGGGATLAALAGPLWSAKRTIEAHHGLANTPWTMQKFHSVVSVLVQNLERRGGSINELQQNELEEVIQVVQGDFSFPDVDP